MLRTAALSASAAFSSYRPRVPKKERGVLVHFRPSTVVLHVCSRHGADGAEWHRTAQRGGAERVWNVPLRCQSMQGIPVAPAGPQAGRRRRLGRAARLDVMVRVSYLLWYVTLRLNLASSQRKADLSRTTSNPHFLTQTFTQTPWDHRENSPFSHNCSHS